jgi:hypothetical protein
MDPAPASAVPAATAVIKPRRDVVNVVIVCSHATYLLDRDGRAFTAIPASKIKGK